MLKSATIWFSKDFHILQKYKVHQFNDVIVTCVFAHQVRQTAENRHKRDISVFPIGDIYMLQIYDF